jgi:hypothetical protein
MLKGKALTPGRSCISTRMLAARTCRRRRDGRRAGHEPCQWETVQSLPSPETKQKLIRHLIFGNSSYSTVNTKLTKQ